MTTECQRFESPKPVRRAGDELRCETKVQCVCRVWRAAPWDQGTVYVSCVMVVYTADETKCRLLTCCIECKAVLVIIKPSICQSNACIVTKWKHLAKKSSIMTNSKLTTSYPMSLRWSAYVAVSPRGGLNNANWPFSLLKNWAFLEESLLQSFFVL